MDTRTEPIKGPVTAPPVHINVFRDESTCSARSACTHTLSTKAPMVGAKMPPKATLLSTNTTVKQTMREVLPMANLPAQTPKPTVASKPDATDAWQKHLCAP